MARKALTVHPGLTVGLGKHQVNVTKEDLRRFNIVSSKKYTRTPSNELMKIQQALFVLQRGNAPCLLCVKTSILIFYTRIFPTKTFKRIALGVSRIPLSAFLFTDKHRYGSSQSAGP